MSQRHFWKRALDVAVAAPGLVAALPFILVAMTAVRATSAGPAIFAQVRLGRGERPFRCYKLRTMHESTPDVPTHQVAPGAVTPLGGFLRRSKLDELPQLWNVLKGDMSLVGPRPCLPAQDELIARRRELGVFGLKPGVTGLAQVRGVDMSDPSRCARTDAEYMEAMSMSRDMLIILRTFVRRW